MVRRKHISTRTNPAVAGLVLAAGFETTVNLLGNGIRMLLDNPEHLRTLSQRPELWPNAVEEILRLESPVQLTARMAQRHRDSWSPGQPRRTGHRVRRRGQPRSGRFRRPERVRHRTRQTPANIWRSPAVGTSAWARLWPAPRAKWDCDRSSIASPTCAPRAPAAAGTPGFCMGGRRCRWPWVRRGRWLRASRSAFRRSSIPASWCTPTHRCG